MDMHTSSQRGSWIYGGGGMRERGGGAMLRQVCVWGGGGLQLTTRLVKLICYEYPFIIRAQWPIKWGGLQSRPFSTELFDHTC